MIKTLDDMQMRGNATTRFDI